MELHVFERTVPNFVNYTTAYHDASFMAVKKEVRIYE